MTESARPQHTWTDRKIVLGMIHVRPLPGTPFYTQDSFAGTLESAVASARALYEGGSDGCLVQTVDRVYPVTDDCDPARLVAVGLISRAIVQATDPGFQVGVQIMRNAVKASLAAAHVTGGSFVRVGALVGQTLSAQGMVRPDPHDVMSYRANIGAQHIRIIADIDSMHYTWFGGGTSTAQVARAAANVGADAVAISHSDEKTLLATVASIRRAAAALPVLLAGGTHHGNVGALMPHVDGAFVGSCVERGGRGGTIDPSLVESYVRAVRASAP